MPDERSAVEALGQLGLTEYEAKCFVALTRIARGTAKEISQLSGVPRSRVYDTVDGLNERGLVDVQESDPREYRAVSKDEAFDVLRRDFDSSIEAADAALEDLESAKTEEEKGVWAIANADHVSGRMKTLLDDANEHVHFVVADETVVKSEVLDRLAAATDRGVTVVVEVPSEPVRDRIEEAVPDARIVVSADLGETSRVAKKWPGQLILVDHHHVLASGVEEGDLPDLPKETAVWTHGHDHGFAAWMRELVDDRTRDVESAG
ncbi:TrmB family transcriptional regulator [Halorarum salinum]|uniref:TrmB family transcriptional regulator n=1 Tax=Halorarum salinum TaxID=2743089 RepID=A0A7D5LDG0_9EURY|nr:TrmB family transcriptional regulator [Halobaculum salinum]QLG63375.1 TrmB family transcriptional regulator [Halobaculum salinum]